MQVNPQAVNHVAASGKRFLVIGTSGVGKTNATNELCGTRHQVSDSAIGTTFEYQRGFRRGHELVDTVGLAEGDAGRVHPAVAFAKLIAFAKDSEEGFNGIFLVTGSPKVTNTMQENYRMFVEQVTSSKVPCYLFINKQEFEDFRTQFQRNSALYSRSGFNFARGFAGGFKTPEARRHTIEQFDRCIACAPEKAERLYERGGLFSFINRLWRFVKRVFAELLGLSYEEPKDMSLVGIFVSLGVPVHLAEQVAANMQADGLSDAAIDDLAERLRANQRRI